MTEASAPGGWRGGLRAIARRGIPFRVASLSTVLLGALAVSIVVMTIDLLATQDRIERASDRFHKLESAAQAQRHFDEMRYWLTDLSVSLLTLSERRAGAARTALDEDLAYIKEFAPEAASRIREGADAYFETALQAADAYTDENRVIGNSLLAAARAHSDAVDGTLGDLVSRLEREADAARDHAQSAASEAVFRSIIAVAAIIAAGAILTFLVLRSIVRPLSQIDGAMHALNAGEDDVDLPAEGDDELGRMSRTLRMLRDSQRERKRLRETSERQRNTILTAIETIPDGFALYDADDRLVAVNQRYREIFPETADVAELGRHIREILGAQARRHARKDGMDREAWIARRLALHAKPQSLTEQELSDGSVLRIANRKTPDGGTVAVFTDITDLKRRQDELEFARTEAESASEAKSRFLASMSHELRTPLNAIIGYSEMLIEDAQDMGEDDFVADLEKIMGSGRHLLSLINDVLDLSKIEAGKMELYVERFALTPLLEDVATTVKPLVDKKGNRLTLEIEVEPDEVETDKTKLRQNLFNLLSNAAKFTENGDIRLKVARRGEGGADWLIVEVSDDGIGMSDEQKARLFEAFVQADDSTTRNYGGTGLGLAITQHFVRMTGGSIEVESALGEGSTFRFRIPAEQGGKAPAEPEGAPEPRGRGLVLVIDDEAAAREAIAGAVRDAGFRVVEAPGGVAGLERAREQRPDAIVLDVIMPDRDGWSVLTELKGDAELCEIPVLLATVVADREMGLAFGAVDHLTKPIDPEKLAAMLAALVSGDSRDVLVIDDDPATRKLCRRILTRDGWDVREASDGLRGLEQIEARRPSLVLLDLMMPRMGGFELLETLRGREDLADLPVIVFTSKDLSREEIDWLRDHSADVASKGVRGRAELVAALRRHVELARAEDRE